MRKRVRRGRLQFVLIGFVFLGPVIIAWLLYDPEGGWVPGGSTEHGQLIEPVKLLSDTEVSAAPENVESPYPGLWSLVHIDSGDCDADCSRLLYETRQVRMALGKERDRVQRILFLTERPTLPESIARDNPDLNIFDPSAELNTEFLSATGREFTGSVYLVDPLGNLIMRFPPNTGMKGMHRDLKKLLSVSHIG